MEDQIPQHIAFIMDGNGRWALSKGLQRSIGHRYGIKALKRTFQYVFNLGIKYMSIYAFSKENLKRPKEEVQTIMKLLDEYIDDCLPELLNNKIRLNIMGDINILNDASKKKIEKALEDTAGFSDKVLNIAFNYSGRDEIIRAANQALMNGYKELDQKVLEKYLYSAGIPDPDLIIRTSGEQRISNFMLYQSAYSELYFTKTLWPDFSKKTLDAALRSYKNRHRKFGDVK